ncbi:hypothetical protein D3C78_1631740 [compost metagenome]
MPSPLVSISCTLGLRPSMMLMKVRNTLGKVAGGEQLSSSTLLPEPGTSVSTSRILLPS